MQRHNTGQQTKKDSIDRSQKSNIRMTPKIMFFCCFGVKVWEAYGSSVVGCLLMVQKIPGSKSAQDQKYYVMCALLCTWARQFTLICSTQPRWIKLGTGLGWGSNKLVVQWTHSNIYNHLTQPLWKGDTSGCTEKCHHLIYFTFLVWEYAGTLVTLLPVHVCRYYLPQCCNDWLWK